MGKTIFTNYVIRPWTIAMAQCVLLTVVAAACTVYFNTLIALAALSSVVGLFIFQRKIRRILKQRGCDTGTASEADSATYLFRGEDGSELRVPKNSRWIFVERKGDKNPAAVFGNAQFAAVFSAKQIGSRIGFAYRPRVATALLEKASDFSLKYKKADDGR